MVASDPVEMASFEHDADVTPQPSVSDDKKEHGHTHGHGHSHEHSEAAALIVALGTVTVGGATFTIDRDGQPEAGKITEFGVELVGASTVVPSSAWLANPDGAKVCDPVSGEGHDSHWHFNVEPLEPIKKSKFVLQVGTEEVAVDFARGAQPVNGGILSVVKAAHAPEWRGFLELKLHGDAGDLELWLYESFPISNWKVAGKPKPLDVPIETVICLSFASPEGKTLEMRVRNGDKNEDEDGTPNMRGSATNYFIFPGETGADADWLVGEKARYMLTVSFEAGGKSYAADPFILVPHEALG